MKPDNGDITIEVENLEKHYPPDIKAVDGISFSIRAGEIFSLLGPNGAGKTTTVEILEGLRNPTSGKVRVLDTDVKTGYSKIRSRIGILPQNFEPFDLLKPPEAIAYWGRLFKLSPTKKEINRLIEIVGLSERKMIVSKKLSGGEKRKLGIALSIVNDPELLFLDEPTTGLDPRARRDLWHLIEEVEKKGTTVLLTTHYLEEAERLAKIVAIMHKGKIIARGRPDELVSKYGKMTSIVLVGAGTSGLEKLKSEGIEASVHNGDVLVPCSTPSDMQSFMTRLPSMDITIKNMYTKRDTLEDVFLSLIGQKMEDGVLQQ